MIGTGKILLFDYPFAITMYGPRGLVLNIWTLGIFRLRVGIFDGDLFPHRSNTALEERAG